ncbi:hypothetical protein BVC93_17800 [Mycobacterium sp. MS1601]|uniref:hypothetical protein n=1 Tax=Mycobacterium sp. MS1601 TaxID=1936029 RepID=UPI0009791AE1|nr:hypothetical protein [Mycobacterium sp. MS1601]AQA03978.1 hypothetical protein BVC93_17800 [Mycobacterium sp. MS1601]
MRPYLTAGFVVFGAALGAGAVSVVTPEPDTQVVVGVSAADEPLPPPPAAVETLIRPVPAPETVAPVTSVVTPVAPTPPVERTPVKWAFTPNDIRTSVVSGRSDTAAETSSPSGSGGVGFTADLRPLQSGGIAADVAASSEELMRQSRKTVDDVVSVVRPPAPNSGT